MSEITESDLLEELLRVIEANEEDDTIDPNTITRAEFQAYIGGGEKRAIGLVKKLVGLGHLVPEFVHRKGMFGKLTVKGYRYVGEKTE